LFEIRYGTAQLTPGKRRKALEDAFSSLLRDDMEERVLSFDSSAADQAARLAGVRRRKGRPADTRDTQITGICEARRAVLATRNTRHFEDISTSVVNSWDDRSVRSSGGSIRNSLRRATDQWSHILAGLYVKQPK
jgi:predicted nucleic acid-binding protein